MAQVVSAITGVFTAIAEWIASAVTAITPMFYVAETGLTFLGTLAVCGLGFAVIFLIIGCLTLYDVNRIENRVNSVDVLYR